MGVGLNIKDIMDKKGYGYSVEDAVIYLDNQGVVAKRTGENIKATTLYAFLNERRNMDVSLVPYFAEWLSVTEQDLFDPSKKSIIAKKEILENREEYSVLFPELQLSENMLSVPIAHIGAGAEAIMSIETIEKIHIEKRLFAESMLSRIDEHTMAFKVIGDSMTPKYNEDDIIFADMLNGRAGMFGDGIWLVRIGDIVQIKQIQFLGHGEANIISTNKDYPTVSTKTDGVDWEIVGKPIMRWGVQYFGGLVLDE